MGPGIVNRAILMLSGSYYIPTIKAIARLIYTNAPGDLQHEELARLRSTMPWSQPIDMLAEKIGIDPLEFRRMNSLKPGQPKSTGRTVEQWPLPELMEAIRPHYDRARSEAAQLQSQRRRD